MDNNIDVDEECSVNNIINHLTNYMITNYNINKLCKKKFNFNNNIINNKENNNINYKENNIFLPKFDDSLFWCFYIIDKGFSYYFLITNNNYLIEKEYKINIAENLTKHKDILKIYKLNKTNIELSLVNDKYVNYDIINALSIILKKSIIILDNNIYFEFIYNDKEPFIIIKKNNKYYLYNEDNNNIYNEYINTIRKKKWKIENYNKPLKSISSYTIKDLSEICDKLDICLLKNNKKKLKKELYEEILSKLI